MIQVHSVNFAGDHIAVQYMRLPDDVRDSGRVAITSQVQLFFDHPDYKDGARKLQDRVRALVEDGLENFADTEPYVPERDEDDDDRGMGE